MVESLLPSFTGHLLMGSILFILFFILFGIVFSGGAFAMFLRGMVRVAVSMVYSPFIYLRRASANVLVFARRGEQDYAFSEQYLLNKFLLWWQAVVIILAMAWLSLAVIRTWYTFLAPEPVRTALREQREKLTDEEQRLVAATADVTRYDAEWAGKKQQLISAFRTQRQQTIHDAEARNASTANEIRQSGNQLAITDLVTAEQYARSNGNVSLDHIGSLRGNLDRWISNQYYLDEAAKSRLRTWIANWSAERRPVLNCESSPILPSARALSRNMPRHSFSRPTWSAAFLTPGRA